MVFSLLGTTVNGIRASSSEIVLTRKRSPSGVTSYIPVSKSLPSSALNRGVDWPDSQRFTVGDDFSFEETVAHGSIVK